LHFSIEITSAGAHNSARSLFFAFEAAMLTKVLATLVALVAGGWMLFDGAHVLLRGKYFGPDKPGPWSIPFSRMGIDPFRLGPMFLVFGVLWILGTALVFTGKPWAIYAAGAVAVATLWYAPVGTVLSLAYLVLLFFMLPRGV
jgi:hypothetical protein